MTGFVVFVIALFVLIAGLVSFNIFTSKKFKNKTKQNKEETGFNAEKAKGVKEEKTKDSDKNMIKGKNNKKEQLSLSGAEKNKTLQGLFNKKDDRKKKKTICEFCGSEVEVYDGSGRCPYCGAKFVKK